MVRPVKENTDPNALIKMKTCTKCKEKKLLVDFPFTYKKYKDEKHVGYKAKCRACECEQQRGYHEQRKQKSLTIYFDEWTYFPSNDGALINIEKVDESKEK